MDKLNPNSSEPALSVGVVTALVGAALALVASFGLDLTPAQTTAILSFTTIVAPLTSAWFTRSRVYSPAAVAEMRHDGAERS